MAMVLVLPVLSPAQSLDSLNVQIHGFATQGFLYTTQNNILTTDSSDGSPAWTEAAVNLNVQPESHLRIMVQAHYLLLGNYGNKITVDYAAADYKQDERFGVRFGKVKTPSGLFNERQDVPPSYLWALLPQTVYPIGSRDSQLAHFGGVVYGTLDGGKGWGKLEYRGWGGERVLPGDDDYFTGYRNAGITLPDGVHSTLVGEAVHWKTPLNGLMVGASNMRTGAAASPLFVSAASLTGIGTASAFNLPDFFAEYRASKVLVAGEYNRTALTVGFLLPGYSPTMVKFDTRPWFVMAAYTLTDKIAVGAYRTQVIDHALTLGPARYSKDWDMTGRYDFNEYLYAKVEEHFISGTHADYGGGPISVPLKPSTRLTLLKVGVTF